MGGFSQIINTLGKGLQLGKEGLSIAGKNLAIAVPISTLAGAYLVSKLMSPGGVSSNISDAIINGIERDELIRSELDLAELKRSKATKSKSKPHDQFL